jgi:pyruvate/2-oxoacid:ferredoxin oxidoreductase beta subunit
LPAKIRHRQLLINMALAGGGIQLVHVYDPVKVENKIKYHEKEIEKAKKLIS